MANRARFEMLFREHYRSISAFCLRRLPEEDAADVVAEVFTTTWDRFDDIEESNVRAWLYSVARNKIAHRWRANGRRSDATVRLQREPNEITAPDPADLVTEVDLLNTAARSLSASDLELLQLISWEGLDSDALSVVLGCAPGAATVRVHRMRKRLEENLDSLQSPKIAGNETEQGPSHGTQMEKR